MADNDFIIKQCSVCKGYKSILDYHNHKYSKDGKKSYCKECNVKKAREYVLKNQDKTKKRLSEWQKNNRDKCRENLKRWVERNPEKNKELRKKITSKRADKQYEYQKQNKEKYRAIKSNWKRKNKDAVCADRAKRRSSELNSIPKWADLQQIKNIYKKAKKEGLSVDHIVPLRSKLVCGLHCETNLALIPLEENILKNNYYWPDMP